MEYNWQQKVLFRHCDPAGIVFYPRYFEMLNDCVEAMFEHALNWPYKLLHETGAIPTVTVQIDFKSPSRVGDILSFDLRVLRVGRTSLEYEIAVSCGGDLRFRGGATLVRVDLGGKPSPWPDEVRVILEQ